MSFQICDTYFMEVAILERTPEARSQDSALFREILHEISRFVLSEWTLVKDFAKFAKNGLSERTLFHR